MLVATCDNDCTALGWQEATCTLGPYDMHISHSHEVDLDSEFPAWDHDGQEMILVSGWLMEDYEEC